MSNVPICLAHVGVVFVWCHGISFLTHRWCDDFFRLHEDPRWVGKFGLEGRDELSGHPKGKRWLYPDKRNVIKIRRIRKKTEENQGGPQQNKKHKTKRKLKDDNTCVLWKNSTSCFTSPCWANLLDRFPGQRCPCFGRASRSTSRTDGAVFGNRKELRNAGMWMMLQWCYMWGNKNKIIIK